LLQKDHNGQTYWLSTTRLYFPKKSKIPSIIILLLVLNEGMIGGSSNLIIDKKTGAVL
jgi:hypothetical protein